MSSPLRATLLSTANKWVQAHLPPPNMAAIAKLRTPETKYIEGPKSLKSSVRNNEEWDAWHLQTSELFSKYEMKINETMVDEEQRKVIMVVNAIATSKGGVPYDNEYVFVITMTDDGALVKEQWAFIDSLTMVDFVKKIGG